MNKDVEIVIPDMLKHMEILTIAISPVMQDLGILIMGVNMKPLKNELPTIRIYLLQKDGRKFNVEKELEAFSFFDANSAMEFVMNLPEMSALELLLMMNGQGAQENSSVLCIPRVPPEGYLTI